MNRIIVPLAGLCAWFAFASPAPAQTALSLPIARAVRVDGPERIDGILDEPFWRDIPAESDFHVLGKEGGIDKSTSFQVAFDGKALLFGITCRQNMKQISANITGRDGPSWRDDSVEVLLQHNNRWYYHFAVNSIGTLMDARYPVAAYQSQGDYEKGVLWNGVEQAAAHRDADQWTAELRIPLATLEIGPAAPTAWRLNIGRSITQNHAYLSWSPVEHGFQDLPHFGRLEGITVHDGQFPIDAAALQFPPMLVGINHLNLRLATTEEGAYRLLAWEGEPAADGRSGRPFQDRTLQAVGGALIDELTVPIHQSGISRQLTLEIDRAGTPVLLRSDLFTAPPPLQVSTDWSIYYDADASAVITARLDAAPGFDPGVLVGMLFNDDAPDKPVASVRGPINSPGTIRLDLPLKSVPDGFYHLKVTAEIPRLGVWTRELQLTKLAGPFDR